MHVTLTTHLGVFQRPGGLAIKIREIKAELIGCGVNASLFNPNEHKFNEFDIVHIFCSRNGNDRVIQTARSMGVPVVLSAQLTPDWTRWNSISAKLSDVIVAKLTRWEVDTSHQQIQRALHLADHVLVESEQEERIVTHYYGVASSLVSVIPAGVSKAFFGAHGDLFRERYKLEKPFVLCAGEISPYKNQLGVVQALASENIDIVLLGKCRPEYRPYLRRCIADNTKVQYFGVVDHTDPLLPSAFAAAKVSVLASEAESGPIVALESLAAGTPVVLTRYNGLNLRNKHRGLIEVDPRSAIEIRCAVLDLYCKPDIGSTQLELLRSFSWEMAGKKIKSIYLRVLADHGRKVD